MSTLPNEPKRTILRLYTNQQQRHLTFFALKLHYMDIAACSVIGKIFLVFLVITTQQLPISSSEIY